MDKPTLLVLAAGMGSRYGGLKQIDPLGPNGEIIIDYSLHDARLAGFERVVFVIKKSCGIPLKRKWAAMRANLWRWNMPASAWRTSPRGSSCRKAA